MIGRLLLALFGMERATERCPSCGRRRLVRDRRPVLKAYDPVALYLDDQITAEELERRLEPARWGPVSGITG